MRKTLQPESRRQIRYKSFIFVGVRAPESVMEMGYGKGIAELLQCQQQGCGIRTSRNSDEDAIRSTQHLIARKGLPNMLAERRHARDYRTGQTEGTEVPADGLEPST